MSGPELTAGRITELWELHRPDAEAAALYRQVCAKRLNAAMLIGLDEDLVAAVLEGLDRRARKAAWRRAYYQGNRDRIRAEQQVYCRDHQGKIKARQRAYRRNNKDKVLGPKARLFPGQPGSDPKSSVSQH